MTTRTMRTAPTRFTRAAIALTAAAGLALAPPLGAGAADAHVTARATGVGASGFGVVTFVVPNESDTAATTELKVTFPALKHLLPEHKDGWVAKVTKDADGAVTEIRWTAAPGTAGIPVGEFGEFNVAGGQFAGTMSLPAVQGYADGTSVAWNQTAADGEEAAHPAPTVTVAAPDTDGKSDTTARWLGSLGLLAGALGITIGAAAARSRRPAPIVKEEGNA